MRFPILIALLGMFGLFLSCDNDTIAPSEPEIDLNLIVLNHDGPNVNAPQLPAGTYEAAARFTPADLGIAVGGKLTEVHYFIQAPPETLEIRIYSGSQGNAPDKILYQRDLSRGIRGSAWNKHSLPTPLTLNQEDVWIALRFSHAVELRSLGCDPGPARSNGDWLFDAADASWQPLSQRAPIDINWNIRAAVDR